MKCFRMEQAEKSDEVTEQTKNTEEAASIAPSQLSKCRAKELEYEIQFFDFSPKALCDSIYNKILDGIQTVQTKLRYQLFQQFPDVPEKRIEAKIRTWVATVQKETTKTCDLFERYAIDKVFYVPAYVLLEEDSVQEEVTATPRALELMDRDIEEMEQAILWYREANEKLVEELKTHELVIKAFGPVVDGLEHMKKTEGS